MKKKPTIEEALKIINDYPNQNDYVSNTYTFWATNGEYCDDSIECAEFWMKCKKIANK